MYSPAPLTDPSISFWDYRQRLLKQKIQMINADVVCLQEVSPKSFEEDFLFMKEELGYCGCEIFKKGRFRPATFWKTDKCSLVGSAIHKDRTLLTVFELNDGDDPHNTDERPEMNSNEPPQYWHVLNCHLQAGLQAGRRLRQIEEGVKASCNAAKLHHKNYLNNQNQKGKAKKEKGSKKPISSSNDPSPHLIICGDFNGGSECAAVRYLEDGYVDPEFMEDGKSTTSKIKKIPKGIPDPSTFIDVPSSVQTRNSMDSSSSSSAPDTMIVAELISNMVHSDSSEGDPQLSDAVLERLERIYYRFASSSPVSSPSEIEANPNEKNDMQSAKKMEMNVQDVERWLCTINGKFGRGSEFRNAAAEMGWREELKSEESTPLSPSDKNDSENENQETQQKTERPPIVIPPDSKLSLSSFQKVYQMELTSGKFWGIAHDLAILGEPLPDAGLYKARFDRMYCTSNLQPYAVIDTLSDVPCPNAMEPSDHLPLAASFTLN